MRNFRVIVNGNEYDVLIEETVPSGFSNKNIDRATVDSAPVSVSAPSPVHEPVVAVPTSAPAPKTQSPSVPAGSDSITSPFPGIIIDVRVSVGAKVNKGDVLVIVEAMKMENEIVAPSSGVVKDIKVSKGATVDTGEILVVLS